MRASSFGSSAALAGVTQARVRPTSEAARIFFIRFLDFHKERLIVLPTPLLKTRMQVLSGEQANSA
jgi:hypothetical protein